MAIVHFVPVWRIAKTTFFTQAENPLLYKRVFVINDMVVSAPAGAQNAIARYTKASSVPGIGALSKLLLHSHQSNFFIQQIAQLHCCCLVIVACPSIQFFLQRMALELLQECYEDRMPSAGDPVGIVLNQLQKGGKC